MLQKFQVTVAKEEADRVDTLRYSYQKLTRQAVSLFELHWRYAKVFITLLYDTIKNFVLMTFVF